MNGKNPQSDFLEEQLYEAQQALFSATSIREMKFLQSKIVYLRGQLSGSKK